MKKTLQYLLYALFLVVTLGVAVMLAKAWGNLNNMKTKVSTLKQELQNKNTQCLELHQEIYDLRNNPHAIEKVARERCKLVKENETIYTYPVKKNREEK